MSTDDSAKVSALTERIDNLIDRLDRFEVLANSQFVRRPEFAPVERLVYGGVAAVLVAVLGAVLSLILR